MANHQNSQLSAQAKKSESLLCLRMVWIYYQTRVLIYKDRFGFLERDSMLSLVCPVFLRIPIKSEFDHGQTSVTSTELQR
jgi:hypothetical protein